MAPKDDERVGGVSKYATTTGLKFISSNGKEIFEWECREIRVRGSNNENERRGTTSLYNQRDENFTISDNLVNLMIEPRLASRTTFSILQVEKQIFYRACNTILSWLEIAFHAQFFTTNTVFYWWLYNFNTQHTIWDIFHVFTTWVY